MTIKQLIFCVESNKQSKTDWIYIRETINRFFEISNEIKLSPIFTGSKMNIKSSKTKKEITKLEKAFKGKTIVICCIDADEKDSNPEYKMEFENLRHFCKENEYEFVWFNKDIEDVYLGHTENDSKKKSAAGDFRRKNMIKAVKQQKLETQNETSRHCSNINKVLKKYLSPKGQD